MALGSADYVFLYMLRHFGINIAEMLTGRNKAVVTREAKNILRKLGINPEDYDNLLSFLWDAGYISMDQKGVLYILGEPLDNLMEKLQIPERLHGSVKKSLFLRLFVDDYGVFNIRMLKERKILTPRVVSEIVGSGVKIPIAIVFEKVESLGGDTCIWEKLELSVKKNILKNASLNELTKVLENEEWLELVLKDLPDLFLHKLFEYAVTGTSRLIVKYFPRLVGYVEHNILDDWPRPAFRVGDYVIVLDKIIDTYGYRNNYFYVFKERDRVGILIRAPSVEVAYYKALEIFDKLVKLYEKVVEVNNSDVVAGRIPYINGYSILAIELTTSKNDVKDMVEQSVVYEASILPRVYVVPIQEGIELLLDILYGSKKQETT